MKQRIRFLALLLTAAMVFACWAVTAFAAQQPHIVLKASGVQGQFILRLDNFSSKFYAAEFAVYVDRPLDTSQIQVAWKDAVPADVNWPVIAQENGRTKLSFYISRNRPIANSNSVELTFPQELPASAFSAGSELKALEEGGASTIFQNPSLTVTGVPASSGSSGGSGGGGGSSDSTLGWDSFSDKITQSGGKKTLTIPVSGGEVLRWDIFQEAAEEKLLLRLDYGSYVWTFDTSKGVNIPAGRIYYDLTVDQLHYKNLSAAVEGSDLAQLEIAHSGPLPCQGILSYPVGQEHGGEKVYLSYYNEGASRLDYRQTTTVATDGMVELTFDRASRYVVSSKSFWSQPQQPAQSGNTVPTTPAASTPPASSEVTVPPEDTILDETPPEPESSTSLPMEERRRNPRAALPPGPCPLLAAWCWLRQPLWSSCKCVSSGITTIISEPIDKSSWVLPPAAFCKTGSAYSRRSARIKGSSTPRRVKSAYREGRR